MEISGPLSVLGNNTKNEAVSGSIGDNLDSFLKILTVQLQNQNPLEPLDVNQFTEQLVQFSTVEQAINQNKNLEKLMSLTSANIALSAASYIGKSIEAGGSENGFVNGEVKWNYNLDKAAPHSTISVHDQVGNLVYQETLSLPKGSGSYSWNGKSLGGQTFTEGRYSLDIKALDAEGQPVSTTTRILGNVDSVELTGTEPKLVVNGRKIPLSEVTYVGA